MKGGSSANGKDTMSAVNPLYQGNMGQRSGLSFENIKAINLAYCADRCSPSSLARPCQHGSYQDPNNCSRCICPDGFAGQYCDALAAPTYGQFCLWSDSFAYHIIFYFMCSSKVQVIYMFCFTDFLLLARYVPNVAKRSVWEQCIIEDRRPTDLIEKNRQNPSIFYNRPDCSN